MECLRFRIDCYGIRRTLNRKTVEYRNRKNVQIFGLIFHPHRIFEFHFLDDCLAFGSYTEMRQRREEFRKKLVALIMTDGPDADDDEFPNTSERRVLKYYHYIRHGIDTVHVAPMHRKIVSK